MENAEAAIYAARQQAEVMGGNDMERDLFNRILREHRTNKISAVEAVKRARAVVEGKNVDH